MDATVWTDADWELHMAKCAQRREEITGHYLYPATAKMFADLKKNGKMEAGTYLLDLLDASDEDDPVMPMFVECVAKLYGLAIRP